MTALPGGAADKQGNLYEHYWTALRIADLLDGTASRLRLEPAGDSGAGIEFEIDIAGVTWGEQVKNSGQTWTVKRLNRESVLEAIKHQTGLGLSYRLITSSPANALATLSMRARAADSLKAFEAILTGPLTDDFSDIKKNWAVGREEAWKILQRVEVETHSLSSLRRNVRLAFQVLYSDDPEVVVAEVRQYCDNHLHQTVMAPQVAAHLKERGFRSRLLAGDDDARRLLSRTVERQQRRVQSTSPESGLVQRSDATAVIGELIKSDGPQLLILDGPAGFGKSAVVAEVAAQLERQGWFVAVARMDADNALPTSDALGHQMGLAESPSVLLAGVADGSPALLVVDQLDAVSLFSGRMPNSFDALGDVLAEIERAENVKVLLVTRSVDLENDPRLRRLLRSPSPAGRYTLSRLTADSVREHLNKHEVEMPSDGTVELLRTPLHLAIYDRLSREAKARPYVSLQDLYDQLTVEVRRRAEQRAGDLDWATVTSSLVTHMNEREALVAPRALLDRFSVDGIAALESEALLVRDGDEVAFFHESYFDYLFARSFVHSGASLHEFLTASGQFLFRRAQTRQVLEYLSATDRAAFRRIAGELLASESLRSHLKHVVAGMLRQVVPTAEDWEAFETVAWSDAPVSSRILGLLSDPPWFDVADQLGRWEGWLADEDRADRAVRQLVFAARERPKRVAELMRPYVGASDDWRLRLRSLVTWSLSSGLVDFAVELIEAGQVDDARGPIAVNSDFWSLLYGVAENDPEGASRLIGAFLRRGLERARLDGKSDPFESGHLDENSQSAEIIISVAGNAPKDFVAEVLPFVAAVAIVNQRARDELLPLGKRWGLRYRDTHYSVDDIVLAGTEEALTKLATADPAAAESAIGALRMAESDVLRFLACRTLTVLRDPDDAVGWLIADRRNLVLGWADSAHWASHELIEQHSGACSETKFAELEAAILGFSNAHELRTGGHGQYALLSALDKSRISEPALLRLGELERRFITPPPVPRGIMASFVASPISDESSTHMRDSNWLSALRKHASEDGGWRGDRPVGGARQLAQVLGQRAKEEPERFARLGLQFDLTVPAVAMSAAIGAVSMQVPPHLLVELCVHAAATYGEPVGRAICSALESVGDVDTRAVALIEKYSQSTDPVREWANTQANSNQKYFNGNLSSAGINCTRGQAAMAAAAALFKSRTHLERLRLVVERLATDPVLAVRVCGAEATLALLNHDEVAALTLAERLFDAPVEIHSTHECERLLTYCMLRDPERFSPQLLKGLGGSPEVSERAGHIWAVISLRGTLPSSVLSDCAALPTAARMGAAEIFAALIDQSIEQLVVLFDDPEPEVRKAAASGLRNLGAVPEQDLDALVAAFADSAAFADHADLMIDAVEALGTHLPASTFCICQLAVDVLGGGLGDVSSARGLASNDLIAIILRLYRQGDDALRSACLDLIDRLADLNAYGLEGALADER